MTAQKQEIRDFNNVVTIAIITITVTSSGITNATAKLKAYVAKYAGTRSHNVYPHENSNIIAATVIFNAKGYKEIDISNEIEAI